MQQQQLAAQLAHRGGSGRPEPLLSPNINTSDSDSDISLGAHSPPISSSTSLGTHSPPPSLQFGRHSPTPLSSFRFGPHSPGPMPGGFRFNSHSPSAFRHNITNSIPIRVDSESSSPPSNMRVGSSSPSTSPQQLTTPLRIRVNSPTRLHSPSEQFGNTTIPVHHHHGIVRIAPPSPDSDVRIIPPTAHSQPQPILHRPFTPDERYT